MMGRKFLAALLAAASIVPATAMAQDRGDRGDRSAARAERMQQRQNNAAPRPQQAAQPQVRAQPQPPQQQRVLPQQQATPSSNWQQPNAQRDRTRQSGWGQNARPQQRLLQPERRDERRDFTAERQRDRQALQAGQVTREAYRADRARDVAAFRGDRPQDRGNAVVDRRPDAQRNWSVSGAGRADQRGWNGNRANANDQRRWDGNRGNWNDPRRYDGNRGNWNGQNRSYAWGNDRGGWNRDWRRDSRYDWNRWRATNRNAFHLPRYYAPYGWNAGYRQFGIGAVLSSVLFAQNYWIDDPWSYRLPEADGPYRWVRYYNDAMLVDLESGEVVDVVNNIFW